MTELEKIPWRKRLNTRIIASLTIAVLLPLSLFYIVSARTATQELLEDVEETLVKTVEQGNTHLARFISEIATDLQPSPAEPDPLSLEADQLALYLSYLLRLEPAVEALSLVDAAGREKARISRTAVILPHQLRDLAEDDAMAAIRENRVCFGPTTLSSDGIPLLSVAVPLGFSGRPHGMLLATISLRRVFRQISEIAHGFENIFIVDPAGTVIGHPDFSLVLARADFSTSPAVARALALRPGIHTPMLTYTNAQGKRVEGMGLRNETLGWGVIAEMERRKALAGVYTIRTAFAVTFLIVAALGVGASLLIGRKISAVIAAIRQAVRAVGSGQFPGEIDLGAAPELVALSNDLNATVARLKDYQAHIEHDVETLNDMVRQRTRSLQQAYDELQQRDRELRQTQAALVETEKLVSLGQLVAGVVHEVNNPLSYIWNDLATMRRGFQSIHRLGQLCLRCSETTAPSARHELARQVEELCREETLSETLDTMTRAFERISTGLERIRKIIADLRDFSRMGKAEREPADLNKAIRSTLSMVQYDIRKKQIQVTTELARLPLVECSPVKISQVLLNILLNAIQAVGEKGHIWITTRAADQAVTISIRDDGHGIPPEIIGKIFDPFFTTREKGRGTGLGLSVSYGIIKEHNGNIDVASAPGAGAEFIVTLPVRPAKSGSE